MRHRRTFGSREFARTLSLVLALAAVIGWASSARAVVIVSDQWRDGTRTDPTAANGYSEGGVDADADGNIESAWFNTGGTMAILAPGGGAAVNGSPNIMRETVAATSASWETYFTKPGAPVTLASTGDFIKVTWTFTATGINSAATNQGFNLALANTNGVARLTSDSGSPGNGAYLGYAMFTNMKTGSLGNGNSFQLRERGNLGGAFLSASGEWNALANGATTATAGYTEGGTYTYVMLMTLNASAGLDIVSTMSGTGLGGAANQLSVSFTDTTPNSLSYDLFGIRPANAAGSASQFDTSLFQVETNVVAAVPETSAFVFGGVICTMAGLWSWRQRRQVERALA